MSTGVSDIYECRRCVQAPRFSTYNTLRAHLRTQHNVRQLSDDDITLYEVYAGSRFTQPPYLNTDGRQEAGSTNQSTAFENAKIAEILAAIKVLRGPFPPPVTVVDNTKMVCEFREMSYRLTSEVKAIVRAGVEQTAKQIGELTSLISSLDLKYVCEYIP